MCHPVVDLERYASIRGLDLVLYHDVRGAVPEDLGASFEEASFADNVGAWTALGIEQRPLL